ncbi:MAG TPA: hypothetical protein EYP36_07625, partial [Calditrichaeota bacterium]|nr:hypothetical protein [Calditrichota bacterium]
MHVDDLDGVSKGRPILISNVVFHRYWANSFLLKKAGINQSNIPDGVETNSNGKPNGTLIEGKGLFCVLPAIPELVNITEEKIQKILPLFTAAGNTTVCEAILGALGFQKSLNTFKGLFAKSETNVRVIALPWARDGIVEAGSLNKFIDVVKHEEEKNSDKFRIGPVKLYTDGSIISRTAPIGWPGYWDGSPEGHMQGGPKEITNQIIKLHSKGITTITHANTRQGCQIVLDAVKKAQSQKYRPDMRHRIEHAYNITEAQLKLARELGVGIQFFSTQIYYYGDEHLKLQGPDRANNMTPTGTAKRLGVSWGFHNVPPGTPQLPWVAAHAAVNRMTIDSGT